MHSALRELQTIHYIEIHSAPRELLTIQLIRAYIEIDSALNYHDYVYMIFVDHMKFWKWF